MKHQQYLDILIVNFALSNSFDHYFLFLYQFISMLAWLESEGTWPGSPGLYPKLIQKIF